MFQFLNSIAWTYFHFDLLSINLQFTSAEELAFVSGEVKKGMKS